jgi:vacuolar-type H+-ATPase subunit H
VCHNVAADFEGDVVVSESIERIRKAEQEAEEIERAARARGKLLIAGAHEAAERELEETRKSARDDEKALRASATKDAEVEAERLVAESRSAVEGLRADAEQRVEASIGKVLELITEGAVTTRG